MLPMGKSSRDKSMHENDVSASNVRSYSYPDSSRLYGAERKFLWTYVKPGTRVLDLGCGEGRVTRALLGVRALVHACDPNTQALEKLRSSITSPNLTVTEGDARALPLPDNFFDVVIFAFNGIDMIHPESGRLKALEEIKRVLRPGGHFLFSSHNPIGMILTPRGLRSAKMWKSRLKRLHHCAFGQGYVEDTNGLLLYQARPRQVIEQMTGIGGMRSVSCTNRSGSVRNLGVLTLFSNWPYYILQKI